MKRVPLQTLAGLDSDSASADSKQILANWLEKTTRCSRELNITLSSKPSPSSARPREADTALAQICDALQHAGRARRRQLAQRSSKPHTLDGAANHVAAVPSYPPEAGSGGGTAPVALPLAEMAPSKQSRAVLAPVRCGGSRTCWPGPTTTPASPACPHGSSTSLGPPPLPVLWPVRSSSNSQLRLYSRKLGPRPVLSSILPEGTTGGEEAPHSHPPNPREQSLVEDAGRRGIRGRTGEKGAVPRARARRQDYRSASEYDVTLGQFLPLLGLGSSSVKRGR